jgi:hypothetical protein
LKSYLLTGCLAAARALTKDMEATIDGLKIDEVAQDVDRVLKEVQAAYQGTKDLCDLAAKTIDNPKPGTKE